jgi:hypothetical protein
MTPQRLYADIKLIMEITADVYCVMNTSSSNEEKQRFFFIRNVNQRENYVLEVTACILIAQLTG